MTQRMSETVNLPLAYDYHGKLPLDTNFMDIKPEEIDLYLDLDTSIGSKTCGQNCQHCWFVNYDIVKNKTFKKDSGIEIYEALKKQKFNVYPRYTDSFAYEGQFMKIFGTSRNRSFKENDSFENTKTMEKGEAWTSGRPLLSDNYEELLNLARDYNYGTIAITFHGILNDDLSIQKEYPIDGVFHGLDTLRVINRIKLFNEKNPNDPFRISIGITVGKHNHTKEDLLKYIQFFNHIGIDSLRFNNFYDHGHNYPNLVLKKQELEEIYSNFSHIHRFEQLNFQLGVSQDFGTYNVEVMNYPKNVEECKAGLQLFAIIPNDDIQSTSQGDIIGTVVGCVNTFEPKLGSLYRVGTGDNTDYKVQFDTAAIKKLQAKRVENTFTNGCFSKELNHAIVSHQY
jgi:MoaA/NifB/PqqE/SkfB family radical SAM enzyme